MGAGAKHLPVYHDEDGLGENGGEGEVPFKVILSPSLIGFKCV